MDSLLDIKKLLIRTKAEILYSSTILEEIISKQNEFSLCEAAARKTCFAENPGEALSEAAKETLSNKEDAALISEFALGLGIGDTESQIEHIELYSELLKGHIKNAEAEYKSKGRLYIALGLFTGVAICVLIL